MNTRQLIQQQRQLHLSFWHDELVERFETSEPPGKIPLTAFSHTVQITHCDGSTCTFYHAFCLHNPSKNVVGIFSEHCGYHTFSSYSAQVIVDDHIFFECTSFG